jgi:hypothetical protein
LKSCPLKLCNAVKQTPQLNGDEDACAQDAPCKPPVSLHIELNRETGERLMNFFLQQLMNVAEVLEKCAPGESEVSLKQSSVTVYKRLRGDSLTQLLIASRDSHSEEMQHPSVRIFPLCGHALVAMCDGEQYLALSPYARDSFTRKKIPRLYIATGSPVVYYPIYIKKLRAQRADSGLDRGLTRQAYLELERETAQNQLFTQRLLKLEDYVRDSMFQQGLQGTLCKEGHAEPLKASWCFRITKHAHSGLSSVDKRVAASVSLGNHSRSSS